MRRCLLIALIVTMLLGSVALPSVCASACKRAKDCCRGGVCHMQAGSCHAHDGDGDAKTIVIVHRATMAIAATMFVPHLDGVSILSRSAALLDGVDRAPERPPRLVAPSC